MRMASSSSDVHENEEASISTIIAQQLQHRPRHMRCHASPGDCKARLSANRSWKATFATTTNFGDKLCRERAPPPNHQCNRRPGVNARTCAYQPLPLTKLNGVPRTGRCLVATARRPSELSEAVLVLGCAGYFQHAPA